MSRRGCFLAWIVVAACGAVDAPAEIVRWVDHGQSHIWTDPRNWEYGRVPGSADRFVTTPYYAQRPDWSRYRVLIDDTVHAVCANAKNMNQLIMDIVAGSLTVYNEWKIGQDDGEGVVINMAGGSVYVGGYVDLGGWAQTRSMGTLNMTGGWFTIAGSLKMGCFETTRSYLNLDGGELFAGSLQFGNAPALIDITEGALKLPGDQRATIDYCIGRGRITAYDGAGVVFCEYDPGQPGTTVVRAVPEPATLAMLAVGSLALTRRKRAKTASNADTPAARKGLSGPKNR